MAILYLFSLLILPSRAGKRFQCDGYDANVLDESDTKTAEKAHNLEAAKNEETRMKQIAKK